MLTITFSLLLLWLGAAQARVQYLGVSIAGGDFGCSTDGTCTLSSAQLPLTSLGHADGQGQMTHFISDGLNLFRLPTSWQFLANSDTVGGTLDATNLGQYDELVQTCLDTGAYCMLDLHNYARVAGEIIGQGGPTDTQFADVWSQLATKYANESKVIFELMNEPHDLDISTWATTCQGAVTAIREAGATSQTILLPGTNYDSAATLVSSGSAAALLNVTNPDGTTTGLLLDVHKYLDADNSGTNTECVTDNVGNFSTLATTLRAAGRQAIVTETGASNDSSCLVDFCAQNAYLNANADVFAGYIGWGAGGFDSSYLLSLTPTKVSGSYVDVAEMTQCIIGPYKNSTSSNSTSSTSSGNSTSSSNSTTSGVATATATVTAGNSTSTHRATTLTTATKATKAAVVTVTVASDTTSIGSYTEVIAATAANSVDGTMDTLVVATGTPTVASDAEGTIAGVLVVASGSASSSSSSSSSSNSTNSAVQTAGASSDVAQLGISLVFGVVVAAAAALL